MNDEKLPAQPGYWAILPAGIRYDDRIPANAKLLYAEISSLTGKTGYCFASDAYFAGLYQMTERTIRSLLKALADNGYIRIEREAGEHNTTVERRIYAGINPLAGAPSSLEKTFQTGGPVRKKFSGNSEKTFQTDIIYQEILTNTPIAPESEALLRRLPPEIARAIGEASDRQPELLAAWLDFAQMRAAKRSPIKTVRTVELLDRKLRTLSRARTDSAVQILQQSVERGWTGLFPLKDGEEPGTQLGSYWGEDPEG